MTIQKWKEAHPEIAIESDALATMAPFPSLYASDFVAYLSSKGEAPNVIEFVRDIGRELVWAYDNWTKAQRDADAEKLLTDILRCADGPGYEFTAKFIRDYAKANNIRLGPLDQGQPGWFGEITEVPA